MPRKKSGRTRVIQRSGGLAQQLENEILSHERKSLRHIANGAEESSTNYAIGRVALTGPFEEFLEALTSKILDSNKLIPEPTKRINYLVRSARHDYRRAQQNFRGLKVAEDERTGMFSQSLDLTVNSVRLVPGRHHGPEHLLLVRARDVRINDRERPWLVSSEKVAVDSAYGIRPRYSEISSHPLAPDHNIRFALVATDAGVAGYYNELIRTRLSSLIPSMITVEKVTIDEFEYETHQKGN